MGPESERDGDRSKAAAKRIYVEFLTRLIHGEDADFEALCDAHPEVASILRRLHGARSVDGEAETVTRRITRIVGAYADPGVTLVPEVPRTPESTSSVIGRLRDRAEAFGRYRIKDEVDRGGMGAILCVWDVDIRRHLAMKVMLSDDESESSATASRVDPRALSRFLAEAQITGQLEHPGIVPVHELGIDGDGHVYFTMRLVKGRDLKTIFDLARFDREGWNRTRAVGVVLRVCEAMSFAHSKGVIHRDLKPGNVMVGRFGETYVMDWGLARIVGHAQPDPLEDGPTAATLSLVGSDRESEGPRGPDPMLATRAGDVIGTPAYMAPEQARGDHATIERRTDVYAVGAILYRLLTGRAPHVQPGEMPPRRVFLDRVRSGPPTPVHVLDRDVPPEIAAICERAMAREVADRYPSMDALGDDLRAYLESRVVSAYQTGAVAEFRKWVERNRPTAISLAALIVVLVTAGFGIALLQRVRHAETVRTLDERAAAGFVAEAARLWPVHPSMLPAMDEWLAGAKRLVEKAPAYRSELEAIRRRAEAYSDDDRARDAGDPELLAELEFRRTMVAGLDGELELARGVAASSDPDIDAQRVARRTIDIISLELPRHLDAVEQLEARLEARRTWRFGDAETTRRHTRLARLVEHLDELAAPATGLVARIERRRDSAANLERRTVQEERDAWRQAIAAIGDATACPAYDGLAIVPQVGLVPLGQDAESGLWEFWHPLSGARPLRGDDGRWIVRPQTGLIFVLLPGASFRMGAQADDAERPNYDPDAQPAERPVHEVRLDPFFISMHEMTQEQWLRADGTRPSENLPGLRARNSPRWSQTNPVEHVSWEQAADVVARWNLALPTAAQWEYAARGGVDAPYWTGREPASTHGRVNSFDLSALALSTNEISPIEIPSFDDGYSHHAPVDAFEPNPFGLHNVLGNVWEWTRDWYAPNYSQVREIRDGDGEHLRVFSNARTYRGGGFESPLADLRVTRRGKRMPNARNEDIGVRPSRGLDR